MFNIKLKSYEYIVKKSEILYTYIVYIGKLKKDVCGAIDKEMEKQQGDINSILVNITFIIARIEIDNPEYFNYINENIETVIAYINPSTKCFVKVV